MAWLRMLVAESLLMLAEMVSISPGVSGSMRVTGALGSFRFLRMFAIVCPSVYSQVEGCAHGVASRG